LLAIPAVHLQRGDLEEAKASFAVFPEAEASPDVQERAFSLAGRANLLRAEGDPERALSLAEQALALRHELGWSHEGVKEAFVSANEAAFDLGDPNRVEEILQLIEGAEPGKRSRTLYGHAIRFRARLAGRRGEDERVANGYRQAAGMFREMATPFWLAQTLLEHGEWLTEHDQLSDAKPLLAESREIFERLGAQPWLERTDRLAEGARVGVAATGGSP
jgi:tetratricopeptide (TPR) repeat protein